MNYCPSIPVSEGTQKTNTIRSIKSASNRSRKSTTRSIASKKSNLNMCTNDFVVVGGGGLDTIDINLPRQK